MRAHLSKQEELAGHACLCRLGRWAGRTRERVKTQRLVARRCAAPPPAFPAPLPRASFPGPPWFRWFWNFALVGLLCPFERPCQPQQRQSPATRDQAARRSPKHGRGACDCYCSVTLPEPPPGLVSGRWKPLDLAKNSSQPVRPLRGPGNVGSPSYPPAARRGAVGPRRSTRGRGASSGRAQQRLAPAQRFGAHASCSPQTATRCPPSLLMRPPLQHLRRTQRQQQPTAGAATTGLATGRRAARRLRPRPPPSRCHRRCTQA